MRKFNYVLVIFVFLVGNSFALPLEVSSYQQETITIKKKQVVALLFGTVRDAKGAPLKGVRVDVFSDVKRLPKGSPVDSVVQSPLAYTETTSEGKYRFQKLLDGKYEVRFTAAGFNNLRLYVEVKPSSGRYKGIEVVLPVAR